MRKKNTASIKRRWWSMRGKKRRYTVIVSICAIAALGLAAVAGPYSTSTGSRRLRSLFFSVPPSPLPSPGNPSKEYIYAGGRLIATEEPNPPNPLVPPANVVAATFSQAQIDVSWNAAPNAHHYVVERASLIGDANFTAINSNVTGTTLNDTTVTSGNAYLYRVRAADAVGNVSSPSNKDLATAITFEDDPLQLHGFVRAPHILQLRGAINAIREVANIPDFTWTQTINPAQPGTVTIKAIDVEELRTALDQALIVLELPAGGYTNSSLAEQLIQKIHITELRDRVK
jgi:hypothetical protein